MSCSCLQNLTQIQPQLVDILTKWDLASVSAWGIKDKDRTTKHAAVKTMHYHELVVVFRLSHIIEFTQRHGLHGVKKGSPEDSFPSPLAGPPWSSAVGGFWPISFWNFDMRDGAARDLRPICTHCEMDVDILRTRRVSRLCDVSASPFLQNVVQFSKIYQIKCIFTCLITFSTILRSHIFHNMFINW